MQTKHYENIGETLYSDILPNGLKIKILPKPGFMKCHAFFATDYGGADRRFKVGGNWIDTPAGVAHFLEHKLFDTPNGNALNILSANGASPNAFTSSGMTAYYFESTQGFYENLRVLLDFVSVPYFTQESVQKEQGIIGQEINMIEDDPDFIVYQNLMRCLFNNHPIRDSVAGSVESIAQISDKTLYDCHKVFYNPSNMALCVVGDVSPEKIREIASEALPKEAGEIPERDYGAAEPKNPERLRSEASMEVAAPLFAFGSRFTPSDKPLFERVCGDISLRCLSGSSSPLYTRLYSEGLINSSFGSDLDYSAKTAVIMISGESRDPDAVVREFMAQAKLLAQNGPDPELFERIRRAAYGSKLRALGSFSGLCASLTEGSFEGYEPLGSFKALDSLTAQDVQAFIADKLSGENVAVSLVLPKIS